MKIELSLEARSALHVMERTNRHVFLTGKAGVGKSTLLDYFRRTTSKNVVVLAPTGVAALNVGGQTIHSFCRFTPSITPQKVRQLPPWDERRELLKRIDAIVIDEVSMVRADLFDCFDAFLRLNRGNPNTPFGGIQLILVGDLHQLPPVVTAFDEILFGKGRMYEGPYFFNARSFKEASFVFVELTRVYRQRDSRFVDLLNAIRNNTATLRHLRLLNQRALPSCLQELSSGEVVVFLTSTKRLTAVVNRQRLEELFGSSIVLNGALSGSFDTRQLPTDVHLALKAGAQVMFLSNDPQGRWVNGTMGTFEGVGAREGEQGSDVMYVRLEDGRVEAVGLYTWEMSEYYVNEASGRIDTRVVGSFVQYPLKLAWAVTIHKSQGKTFDRVVIDVGRGGTFAPGQLYVALSRCRSLEGIALRRPLLLRHIITDQRVVEFLARCQSNARVGEFL